MAQVIVTGSSGQLGSTLQAQKAFSDVLYLDHNTLDIQDTRAVRQFLEREKPAWVVNCAAYTAVDAAQNYPDLAFAINAYAVRQLAESCAERGIALLHISTDYVFGGVGNSPHNEHAVVHPEGIYAQSKYAGEVAVLNTETGIVLRTSWLYSYFGKNFFRTILKKCLAGESLRVVADQCGSPTWTGNLANAISSIVTSGFTQRGVFHYTDLGICSWYDFACFIRYLAGTSNTIVPINTEEWKAAAPRPSFSVLDSTYSRALWHLNAQNWMEGVSACYHHLLAKDNGTFYKLNYF